jgi:hypothetical protein
MLVGSIADMANHGVFAKRPARQVPRTVDHEFFSMP